MSKEARLGLREHNRELLTTYVEVPIFGYKLLGLGVDSLFSAALFNIIDRLSFTPAYNQ